jgi:hypothetical protein
MLVDNKFIYVSIPRCASMAFHYSCLSLGIDVVPLSKEYSELNSKLNISDIDKENLMNFLTHGHERLIDLRKSFGYHFPVISVKRNRYERFYSLFKHAIADLRRIGELEIADHFSRMNNDEFFFFDRIDISTPKKRWEKVNTYLIENKLIKKRAPFSVYAGMTWRERGKNAYIVNIIDILLTPASYWHGNDPDIIWFDFDELDKMEDWVSQKIGKEFKIVKANSSQNIDCLLKIDGEFVKKYDDIYEEYDFFKSIKSII